MAAAADAPSGAEDSAQEALDRLRRLGGSEGIDLVLDYYGLDMLVAPADTDRTASGQTRNLGYW